MMHLATWTEPAAAEDSLQLLEDLSLSHALQGGRVGMEIAELIKARDWPNLLAYQLDYTDYSWDILQLINCRQALAFYQKLSWLEVDGVNREVNAVVKWYEAEEQCAETNRLFLGLGVYHSFQPGFSCILEKSKRLIKSVLGPCPKVEELPLRFGPKATASIKRNMATPQEKLAEMPTCSPALYASGLLPSLFRTMPHYLCEHRDATFTELASCAETLDAVDNCAWEVDIVTVMLMDGSVQFVNKNALSLRSMESQPTLNTILQLGIGDFMTKRLLRAGIDIRDQSLNQRLARVGSLTGELATIDLSSASDTIAYQLVKFLLPPDWFALLSAGRCASTTVLGRHIRLQKFSAMGNGYTFPLETLIFWALSRATCGDGDTVSAYGDDIVVPSNRYDAVKATLTSAGFSLNDKKSYYSGCFRESCGADWFLGIDIRPFYLKNEVTVMELFKLHNWYVRHLDADRASRVADLIPLHLRRFGPDGYGDGHLIGSWEGFRNRAMRRSGFAGAFFKTFRIPGREVKSAYPGDYVTPLYQVYCRDGCSPEVEGVVDVVDSVRSGSLLEVRRRDGTLHRFTRPLSNYTAQEILGSIRIVEGMKTVDYLVAAPIAGLHGEEVCRYSRPVYDAPGAQSPVGAVYEEMSIYTLHP